jgi:predicted nucleic acid-binding protein
LISLPGAGAFFDTNVPLYLLSGDVAKATRAEALLAAGGTVSVQVLNEFTAVARRKHRAPWATVHAALVVLRGVSKVEPLTLAVHDRAIALAERFGMPIYDATIAASALLAGCSVLYSEDFQHGQVIDHLTIVNPFA